MVWKLLPGQRNVLENGQHSGATYATHDNDHVSMSINLDLRHRVAVEGALDSSLHLTQCASLSALQKLLCPLVVCLAVQ